MKKELNAKQKEDLLICLKNRFEKNTHRHVGLKWDKVLIKLKAKPEKLWSLNEMEKTGGEPDVIDYNKKKDEYTFCDCSPESPAGRRSLCYDQKALDSRKENKPKNNAIEMATQMGVEILDEEAYRKLQLLEHFDNKTSSWVLAPASIRKLGGAIFCDYRFDRVFTYHNGAESYYASRGFRAFLIL
jgi:hypothetical protein